MAANESISSNRDGQTNRGTNTRDNYCDEFCRHIHNEGYEGSAYRLDRILRKIYFLTENETFFLSVGHKVAEYSILKMIKL